MGPRRRAVHCRSRCERELGRASTFRAARPCASRQPNGNVLICSGKPGRLLEVTRAGRLVWDYESPFFRDAATGNPGAPPATAVYRAVRIPPDHPGLRGRDL